MGITSRGRSDLNSTIPACAQAGACNLAAAPEGITGTLPTVCVRIVTDTKGHQVRPPHLPLQNGRTGCPLVLGAWSNKTRASQGSLVKMVRLMWLENNFIAGMRDADKGGTTWKHWHREAKNGAGKQADLTVQVNGMGQKGDTCNFAWHAYFHKERVPARGQTVVDGQAHEHLHPQN
eukprot:scaffold32390_cov16-Tisochrysis_lutea.AAC.2